MNSENSITLIGRPMRPVTAQETKAGRSYCSFTLECGNSWTRRDGTSARQDSKSYFTVVVWGDAAVQLADICQKALVTLIVVGRLQQRSYEDKYGNRKSVVEVVAEDFGVSVMRPPEALPAEENPF